MLHKDNTEYNWLSAHIFFHGNVYSKECDRIILEIVDPFVQICQEKNWITCYFFIRYGENGPHVRLRLYGMQKILKQNVKPLLITEVDKAFFITRDTNSNVSDNGDSANQTEALPHVLWIPYEQEVDRYGGPAGIALAESFFHYSSEISIALLKNIVSEERSSRLGKALMCMIVLIYTFLSERTKAAIFARHYTMNYLRSLVQDEEYRSQWLEAFGNGYTKQSESLISYVNEAWERLNVSDNLSDILDRYHQNVCEIGDRFKFLLDTRQLVKNSAILAKWEYSVYSIVSSYMHMMNNRLGVNIHEESYLSYLIHRALDKSDEHFSLNNNHLEIK